MCFYFFLHIFCLEYVSSCEYFGVMWADGCLHAVYAWKFDNLLWLLFGNCIFLCEYSVAGECLECVQWTAIRLEFKCNLWTSQSILYQFIGIKSIYLNRLHAFPFTDWLDIGETTFNSMKCCLSCYCNLISFSVWFNNSEWFPLNSALHLFGCIIEISNEQFHIYSWSFDYFTTNIYHHHTHNSPAGGNVLCWRLQRQWYYQFIYLEMIRAKNW